MSSLHKMFRVCLITATALLSFRFAAATPAGPFLWDNMLNSGVFTAYAPPGAVSSDALPGNQLNYGTPAGMGPQQHAEFLITSPLQVCYGTSCPDANPFSRPGGFRMGSFYGWSQEILPGTGITSAAASIALVHDFGTPGQSAEGTPTMYTVDQGAFVTWWFVNADGSVSNQLNIFKGNNVIVDLWGIVIGEEDAAVKTYNILGFDGLDPRVGFITAVPEPGTMMTLTGGFALLGIRAWRNRSRRMA